MKPVFSGHSSGTQPINCNGGHSGTSLALFTLPTLDPTNLSITNLIAPCSFRQLAVIERWPEVTDNCGCISPFTPFLPTQVQYYCTAVLGRKCSSAQNTTSKEYISTFFVVVCVAVEWFLAPSEGFPSPYQP